VYKVGFCRKKEDFITCYRLRKHVFADLYDYFSIKDELMFDVFDTLPDTYLIKVEKGTDIVATVRLSFTNTQTNTPIDGYYDFSPIINDCYFYVGSMFCADPKRENIGSGHVLLHFVNILMRLYNVKTIIACINPRATPLLKKMKYGRLEKTSEKQGFEHKYIPVFNTIDNVTDKLYPLNSPFFSSSLTGEVVFMQNHDEYYENFRTAANDGYYNGKKVEQISENLQGYSCFHLYEG
jgi:N-acyl amino acid synthase FeeM